MLNKGNEELTFIPPARLSELNLMRSDGNDANECVIWIHELTTVCKNSTVDMWCNRLEADLNNICAWSHLTIWDST